MLYDMRTGNVLQSLARCSEIDCMTSFSLAALLTLVRRLVLCDMKVAVTTPLVYPNAGLNRRRVRGFGQGPWKAAPFSAQYVTGSIEAVPGSLQPGQ